MDFNLSNHTISYVVNIFGILWQALSSRHQYHIRTVQRQAVQSSAFRLVGECCGRCLWLSPLVLGEIRKGVEMVRGRGPQKAKALEVWLKEVTQGLW